MPLTVSRCWFWRHELTLQEKSMLRGLKPAWQRSGKNPLHPVLDLMRNKYQEFGFRLLNLKFERRSGIRKTSICSPTNSEAPQRKRCHQVGFVRGSVATNQPTALQRGCPGLTAALFETPLVFFVAVFKCHETAPRGTKQRFSGD